MIKLIPEMMYIVIAIAFIILVIFLSWQHVPKQCHTDLNSTSDVVLLNLERCIDNCWKKHDFGRDLENDDCYVINVFVRDRSLTEDDFTNKNYVRINFDSLERLSEHKLKVRYNAIDKEINLVKVE